LTDLAADKPKTINFNLDFDGTATPVKTALFLVVLLCWLLPGLVGHDPWKPQEGQTIGVVHSMIQSGDWLVPSLAGEPFLERPPLYYWTAAVFAKAFSPLLPVHDAARLASGFYMVLAILLVTLTAVKLFGPRFGRVTSLIFIGSFGLLVTAHMLAADTAMVAAAALLTYGLASLPRQVLVAGLCFGAGIGIAFLAKGSAAAALALAMVVTPFLLFRAWRTRPVAQALGIGLLAALPWILWWPASLYVRSPQLAMDWLWLKDWAEFSGAFSFASLRRLTYYLVLLPWYAWPALPLVCVMFWYGRGRLIADPKIQLLAGALLGAFVVLCLTGDTREAKALPILIPLSLICSSRIDGLSRGAASALDWFGMMTFGLLAAGMWIGWFALLFGFPEPVLDYLQSYLPGYQLEFRVIPFMLALILSVLWLIAITRSRQSNRRAIVNWTAGITMFWMLAMTLWLPFIDEGKSYRAMATSLKQALPTPRNCVASRGLGEAQRGVLDYFIDLRTRRLELKATNNCRYLLTQGIQTAPTFEDSEDWRLIWEGARPGDQVELYRLYQRRKNSR
jgi:4-amino-4-deoxy-L-arabinose transferase-like glycosyltransferase